MCIKRWNILWGAARAKLLKPIAYNFTPIISRGLRETQPQSPMALMLPFPVMVKWPWIRELSGFATAKNMFGKIEETVM